MANIIQIKRSDITATPATGGLVNGELAYSYEATSNSLFIGDNNANAELVDAIRIGGSNYTWLHQANTTAPGTLTANAVVITNGNSYINEVKLNTLTLGVDGSGVSANLIATAANSSALGVAANNELATTWAVKTYVDGSVGELVGGGFSNGQIAYSDDGQLVGVDTFILTANSTYANVVIGGQDTGELYVGNTSGAAIILTHSNAAYSIIAPNGAEFSNAVHVHADGTTDVSVTLTNETFVASAEANSEAQMAIQNISDGANASSDFAAYSNDPVTDDSGFINLGINSNNYTDAVYSITGEGEGYLLMSATTGAGKSGDLVIATDDTGTKNDIRIHTGGFTNADAWAVRIAGNNDVATASDFYVGGSADVTGSLTVDVDATISGNVIIGSDTSDNVAINALVSTDIVPLANVTQSLGTSALSWNAIYGQDLTLGATATVGTDLTVNGDATLNGNTTIGSDSSDGVAINAIVTTALIPEGNNALDLGSTTARWGDVYANSITLTNSLGVNDLTVTGNLTVQGTLTTIESTTLTVNDPMIQLANGQSADDLVDIGFFGSFGNSTVTQYAGLFRDQNDSGIFKLFEGEIAKPDNNVDTANDNFTLATLLVGELRTASANITGGSITGITDITVADGGTGVSTFTTQGVLFGDGSNALKVTAAGSEGEVLQVAANGDPYFAMLDGGTF